jgi:histidine triad (HIT) family protein
MKVNCIFCKIVRGDIPAFKVYEDGYTLAFLDIAPVNPGHVLVISKFHAANLDDVDDLMLAYMMRTVQKVGQAMRKSLGVKGYNVIVNNGKLAGQLVDHCHIHVIPRYEKDGLTPWPQAKYQDDEARKIVAKLKSGIIKIC